MSNLVRLVTTDRLITVKELLGCGTSNMRARARVSDLENPPKSLSCSESIFLLSSIRRDDRTSDPKAAVVRFGRTSETRKQRIRRARFLLPPSLPLFETNKRSEGEGASEGGEETSIYPKG